MTNLLTPDEIKRVAALAGRHAEERATLAGRQENERRELAAKQQAEMQKTTGEAAAFAAPILPVKSTKSKGSPHGR